MGIPISSGPKTFWGRSRSMYAVLRNFAMDMCNTNLLLVKNIAFSDKGYF